MAENFAPQAQPQALVADSPRLKRADFLVEVYRQTSTHLGRHISGLWQCVGVVGAAFAVFAFDKGGALTDFAASLAILLCGWLAATTLDANHWFNRNLAIITNVERLFLGSEDLALVHPFFKQHRSPGALANHFKIQLALAIGVAALVLIWHSVGRIPGDTNANLCAVIFAVRALPYWIACLSVFLNVKSWLHYLKADMKQNLDSPGLPLS